MQMPQVQTTYFPLKGGLNLVTPPLSMPDGSCRDALNFEVDVDGGYRRVAGYERFDGRPTPSTALYSALPLSALTGAVAVGDTVNGQTSGATAQVVAVTSTALFLGDITGTFSTGGETIRVGVTPVATSSAGSYFGGAETANLDAQYLNLAADVRRALIQPVPGSGAILGVWLYNNVVYAFRNIAGGTAAKMFKSTATGWSEVTLNNQVSFTNANLSVNEGDTLTQGGVTATILRVVVETGTLMSGTNTGRLIIGNPSGGNFAAGAATSTGGGSLTLSGAQTAITLQPGGKYEFTNYNFGGAAGTYRMYGVSGTNQAFEFDGTVYVPLRTGLTDDKPTHLCAHLNYLWVTYGSSLQRSSIADPYMWQVITGAAELAAGDTITQIIQVVGSNQGAAMAVFTANRTLVLYGSTEADLQLVPFSQEAGAYAYTAQNIGDLYVLDQLGVRQLSASQNFGNFDDSQVTRIIRPWIIPRTNKAVGSCIVRQKNQYRLYFNDKSALYITFDNGRVIGMMPISTEHTFNTVSSVESNDGEEWLLAGSTDGYVYRLEKGTSYDGEPITYYLNLAFSYMRSPRIRKTFRKAVYEISGGAYSEIEAAYELGYASTELVQGDQSTLTTPFGGVFWDAFTWDAFYWDGRTLLPIEQKLYGNAENISLILRGRSDYFQPFTINSAIIQYLPRRLQR